MRSFVEIFKLFFQNAGGRGILERKLWMHDRKHTISTAPAGVWAITRQVKNKENRHYVVHPTLLINFSNAIACPLYLFPPRLIPPLPYYLNKNSSGENSCCGHQISPLRFHLPKVDDLQFKTCLIFFTFFFFTNCDGLFTTAGQNTRWWRQPTSTRLPSIVNI
jgi:hypothetical protein